MNTPNLFRHARSELAQDAVLAYLLEWAHPKFRSENPVLHGLGARFLHHALKQCGISPESLGIVDLEVKSQENRVDVLVNINDGEMLLFIEDKVEGKERKNQIKDYKEMIRKEYARAKDILALYVKTGNESLRNIPRDADGCLFRRDLLSVLGDRHTGHAIVDEFREHLKQMEKETNIYHELSVREEWPWRAVEGFYSEVEQWILDEFGEGEGAYWGEIHNPSESFHELCWHWKKICVGGCCFWLHLQLRDAKKLLVRLSWIDDCPYKEKVRSHHLEMVHSFAKAAADKGGFSGLSIERPQRFRGGGSGTVAIVGFEGKDWIPQGDRKGVDMEKAKMRLRLAMKLVDAVANAVNRQPSLNGLG